MGKASKKIALIESKCDFNIDGMKLFRFHFYSDTDFLSHEEIPDTHENCLSFILCSTGKIRIQLSTKVRSIPSIFKFGLIRFLTREMV